jgi:hypothetical protein
MGRPPKPFKASPAYRWKSEAAADEVQKLFDALEIADVDAGVRYTLQRWVYRADKLFGGDRGNIILTLRCIVESTANGPEALLDPILSAVHSSCRPEWTRKGLDFIAAFDGIDLRALLDAMRGLRCFQPDELGTYLATALRSRLLDIFGSDAETSADPGRKAKRIKRARGRLPAGLPRQSAPAMEAAA